MSIVKSTLPWGESVPVRINNCKYCGEHFATQARLAAACNICKSKNDYCVQQEWTVEEKRDIA